MSPNLQAELGAALRTVLDEMSATTAQLITVLDEEREALNSADAKALNRSGEAKQMLMRRLEQLDVERLHLSSTSAEAAQQMEPTWREPAQRRARRPAIDASTARPVRAYRHRCANHYVQPERRRPRHASLGTARPGLIRIPRAGQRARVTAVAPPSPGIDP
jgi:hypothetical protein